MRVQGVLLAGRARAHCAAGALRLAHPSHPTTPPTTPPPPPPLSPPRAAGKGLNLHDIAEGLVALGFPACVGPSNAIVFELHKRHPGMDPWMLGRVRVALKTKDGAPTVPAYATKEQVLVGLGRVIPTLESRRVRNENIRRQQEELMRAQLKEHARRTGQPLLAAGGGGGKR